MKRAAYVALLQTLAVLVFFLGSVLAAPFYGLFRILLALGLTPLGWACCRVFVAVWEPFVFAALWVRSGGAR